MSRELWIRPTGQLASVVGAALEAGATGVLVEAGDKERIGRIGRVRTGTLAGTEIDLGGRAGRIAVIGSPREQEVARALLGKVEILVIAPQDWNVIPLENLVAWAQSGPTLVFAQVTTESDARLALATLERGVHGLVLETSDADLVRAVARLVNAGAPTRIELTVARVVAIEDAGLGDRVCVDTTSMLEPDEGLLVGSSSGFLALVASEATESGYVEARPFRVNAGAVHAYVLGPDNATKYLSEVRAGTRLATVRPDGSARVVTTGRAKIERRPMTLVRLKAEEREGTVVVQNAETIRLVGPGGAVSVAELAVGDEVLVHTGHAKGRHFGTAIEETIREI